MGAAIGMMPDQVDRTSMWKLFAAIDGYVKAHGAEDESLSSKETDDLWAMVQRKQEKLSR